MPPETDSNYKRWIVEEEILYIWILNSMMAELANRFIEYETAKDIWDAVQKYHFKKNDQSTIVQLVNRSCALQQGEKSILAYANKLNAICRELDHFCRSVHDLVEQEYTLIDRVYRLLQGLRPEFEGYSKSTFQQRELSDI